eukprot:976732-Karenia_brevis.AAC.1
MTLNTTVGLSPSFRMSCAAQMQAQNVVLAGFQEARADASAREQHGYFQICSGAQHGREGCEFWAALHIPYAVLH